MYILYIHIHTHFLLKLHVHKYYENNVYITVSIFTNKLNTILILNIIILKIQKKKCANNIFTLLF